jgi:hypothetical protein
MKTNTFLTGSVLAVAALGCGSVSGIPIEQTANEFAKTICPKAYECCTTAQLMNNDAAGTTEQECETKTAKQFRDYLQTMQDAENGKRAKYEQEQVDACLAALRTKVCSDLTMIRSLKGIPECDSTFATPLVALGGTCKQDFECIDSVCVQGVCAAGMSVGGSCVGDGNKCGQNLFCDPRDGSIDNDSVCVVEQDNGATCVDNFECKSRSCVAPAAGGAKVCTAPASQCFYGGGCSAAGGRPGAAALLIMAAFAAVALFRSRRVSARSRR